MHPTSLIESISQPSQDVLCMVNVQHDCERHKCPLDSVANMQQKCEESSATVPWVKYIKEDNLILNMLQMRSSGLLMAYWIPLPPFDREHDILTGVEKECSAQDGRGTSGLTTQATMHLAHQPRATAPRR